MHIPRSGLPRIPHHPRSPFDGCGGQDRRPLYRIDRYCADNSRLDRFEAAARVRRTFADPLPAGIVTGRVTRLHFRRVRLRRPGRADAVSKSPWNASNFAILREKRFKLVHFNAGLPPLPFDQVNDPPENANLADDPDHRAKLYRLTTGMLGHRMRHADQSRALMMLTDDGVKSGDRR